MCISYSQYRGKVKVETGRCAPSVPALRFVAGQGGVGRRGGGVGRAMEELRLDDAMRIGPVARMMGVADMKQVREPLLWSTWARDRSRPSGHNMLRVMSQVYELELPMLGAPRDFFHTFYADHAEWTQLQHKERGDKGAQAPPVLSELVQLATPHHPAAAVLPRRIDVRTGKWLDVASDGSQQRIRSFNSPFETTFLEGVAKVREEQTVKCAADGSRLVLAASVSMDGDVPYCDCYRVHTLIDVTLLSDAEQAKGLLVRVFMGPEFVKYGIICECQ